MQDNMIKAYTDGGCSPNPGKGAWAFAINSQKFDSGFKNHSTNNEMEIKAIIECIKYVRHFFGDEEIIIYSDSKYCVNGFSSWMHGWFAKGWKKPGGPIKNLELWKELYSASYKVKLKWVKGHSGNPMNDFVDNLCSEQLLKNTYA